MFVTEGRMFQGVDMSLVGPSHALKLCRVPVSMIGAELSKAIERIWPRA
jgi:hypothetical protein